MAHHMYFAAGLRFLRKNSAYRLPSGSASHAACALERALCFAPRKTQYFPVTFCIEINYVIPLPAKSSFKISRFAQIELLQFADYFANMENDPSCQDFPPSCLGAILNL